MEKSKGCGDGGEGRVAADENLAYTELNSPTCGRYLVAARDIRAGELVFKDIPVALGPLAWSDWLCLGCHVAVSEENHVRCPGCWWPMCSLECCKTPQHVVECPVLATDTRHIGPPTLQQDSIRYDTILTLRCLLLQRTTPEAWQRVAAMADHVQQRLDDKDETHIMTTRYISKVLDHEFELDDIHHVHDAIVTNCFEWPSSPTGVRLRGVYTLMARMNHSCLPNMTLQADHTGTMDVRAAIDLVKGQPLSITYLGTNLPLWERRAYTRNVHYFMCECTRCEDPTELGIHYSSPKCTTCKGYFEPSTWLTETKWECPGCNNTADNDLVYQRSEEVMWRLDCMDTLQRGRALTIKNFMMDIEKTFHKTHYVWEKSALAAIKILRGDKSLVALKLRVNLQRKLLQIYDVLEPGLTRRRGVSLYELGVSETLLARTENTEGKLTNHFLRKALETALAHLQEALAILNYEPESSAERRWYNITAGAVEAVLGDLDDIPKDQPLPDAITKDQSLPDAITKDQSPPDAITKDQSPPDAITKDQSPPKEKPTNAKAADVTQADPKPANKKKADKKAAKQKQADAKPAETKPTSPNKADLNPGSKEPHQPRMVGDGGKMLDEVGKMGEGGDEGVCAVCGDAAKQRCGGCGEARYCGRICQQEHWTEHRESCTPIKHATHPDHGRLLVASRDLGPGQLVIDESPLVMGPAGTSFLVCLGCHAPIDTPEWVICPGCAWPLCSPGCQHKPLHDRECDILATDVDHVGPPTDQGPSSKYDFIITLRCLLLRETNPDAWEKLMELQGHEQARSEQQEQYHMESVKFFTEVVKADVDVETIHKVRGIVITNCVNVLGPRCEYLRGIYPNISLLNHSCLPNVTMRSDVHNKLYIHASIPIKRNDPLLFSYSRPEEPMWQRSFDLKNIYFFKCECNRCKDVTEMGTHFSGLRCPRCPGKFVEPKDGAEAPWKCPQCQIAIPAQDIEYEINTYLEGIGKRCGTVEEAKALNTEIEKKFHGNHYVWVTAAPQMLRGCRTDNSIFALRFRQDIWRRLLRFYEIFEAGCTRRRGVTLYQLSELEVYLARAQAAEGDMDSDMYVAAMTTILTNLDEASAILSLEPPASKELRWRQRAMDLVEVVNKMLQDYEVNKA